MKIVQVVTQMEAGGAQKVALSLANALRERGHHSELWFLYRKRRCFEGEAGLHVLLDHPPGALDYLRIAHDFETRLRAGKPDALITHTHYANVLCQPIARRAKVKHRVAVQHNPLSSYPRIARVADVLLGSGRTYTANIAVSDAVIQSAAAYPRQYREQLTRIHNGVELPSLAHVDRAATRQRWGVPERSALIVNVGRLAAQKNQDCLVRAMPLLPQAHLVIAGEGELRGPLEHCVRRLELNGRVTLAGELPWQEVLSLVSAADVFAFPSRFEAMPLAIVEAMALGVPVVASEIPATREVAGDAGILVDGQEPEAFAAAIGRILSEPALREALRTRGQSRSRAFTLESMVAAYEHLLH